MKYSIIIPALNEERLLPRLLNQLNDKNFRSNFDVEVILSDGGSTDKTVEIAQKNCTVVKVKKCGEVQNIAGGRNSGAEFAEGDLFFFINADIIFPDIISFFRKMENKFVQSTFCAMTCSVKVFPEEEVLSDRLFHFCYNKYFKFLNFIGIGMGRGECQIVRKDIFRQVNGYNETLAAGEDFDLFRRIRRYGRILFCSDLVVYESPRRYRKLGYSGVTWSWIKNGFSVFFKNKSISKQWEAVR